MNTTDPEIAVAMGELRATVATKGWQVIEATLSELLLKKMDMLSLIKRSEDLSDDFIRGEISGLKYVLGHFRKAIEQYDTARAATANATTREPDALGSPYAGEAEANPTA